ncbi:MULTISPECIES: DUF2202 domain-containing protein [unclassified Microbacterium]|uniref:DUF2202 domain-containing protein n=1 Tax=unclassified Microbacterium TaxID=2609290 RepID=UPI0012FE4CE0|nr:MULTISPECIES: DUF2202 domain-containing protein [unclassified Microbacterium]
MNTGPTRTRSLTTLALSFVALSTLVLAGCSADDTAAEGTVAATQERVECAAQDTAPSEPTDPAASAESRLPYLIEEEKLAHDVYTALGEMWDVRVFSNIAASETTHEGAVAEILPAYDLADPRTDELAVFTDASLQAMYDDLIALGSRSLADAIQVGITIEKTDIADLSATIPGAPADIAALLKRLLTASENHLAAFERQA